MSRIEKWEKRLNSHNNNDDNNFQKIYIHNARVAHKHTPQCLDDRWNTRKYNFCRNEWELIRCDQTKYHYEMLCTARQTCFHCIIYSQQNTSRFLSLTSFSIQLGSILFYSILCACVNIIINEKSPTQIWQNRFSLVDIGIVLCVNTFLTDSVNCSICASIHRCLVHGRHVRQVFTPFDRWMTNWKRIVRTSRHGRMFFFSFCFAFFRSSVWLSTSTE